MQRNNKTDKSNLENTKKKDINNSDEDDLIFENLSIDNASLAAGIEDEINAKINSFSKIHFDDSIVPSTSTDHKVKFRDCYSVPNATLAAGINYDDSSDTNIICKSIEYYNNVFNNGPAYRRINPYPHISIRQGYYNPSNRHNSMMDYISKSQPMNGSNNLLSQYTKFHQGSGKLKSNGQDQYENLNSKDIDEKFHNTRSSNSIPVNRPRSLFNSAYSISPVSSPKSVHSIIFDPNINIIPSFKGKKQVHSHHHHPSTSSNGIRSNSFSFHPMSTNSHYISITQTLNMNIEENNNNKLKEYVEDDNDDNENEPLMMSSHQYPSDVRNNNNASLTKKAIHAKRRLSHSHISQSPKGSIYGSYSSSIFGSIPMSSTILAKTSQYIPDASLPYLVKTINSHLVNNEDYTENINKVYNLKGGDVARDIYNFNEKIKRTILSKRSKSEPNLYELNKKNENDFNISDISTPGGFRREFMSSNAKKQGKAPPNWITSNFIDFLALYGHYAGDDDFDEDYYSEGYDSSSDWDIESEADSEMNLLSSHKYDDTNKNFFDDKKLNIIETQSSYEVLEGVGHSHGSEYKSKINIEIDNMNENTPLLNVNMSQNTINPRKNRKYRKNNVPSQTGTASEGKTMFLLLKAFIGTGILFLPKAFSNGGMLFSLISLAFSGWLTYFTMILLIRCSEHIGGSYGDIGKQLFGKPFKIMIQGSIALTQSGFCCAYIIFVLQSVKSIISTVGNGSLIIPDWVIITAQVLIYIPLSWIRKIQNFSITSLVADVFILIGLVYIISSDLFIISSNGHSNNYTLFNSDKFPLFLGTAIFAYEGIGLIIPLQRSMKEPEKFPKVLRNSMYIISLAMFIVGGLSYYIFGDDVHTIIFMNVFPDSIVGTVVRALYTLAIVFSFPLTCYSGIHIIEPLFIPRRKPFKSFGLKRKRKAQMNYGSINQRSSSEMLMTMNNNNNNTSEENNELENEKLNQNLSLSSNNNENSNNNSNSTSHGHRRKRDTGKNSQFIKWMKNVFRAVFVSCLGVIAYYGASNLDNFVSIIGSSCCIPLMFIYPAMLHYYGVAEKPSEKMTDIGVIIFGVISTIWITKLSLEEWK
jgi:amino acid permease